MPSKSVIKETKSNIVKKHGKAASDTGKTEVQIALVTQRINHLNQHFGTHQKDHHSKRGLLRLVGQRKRLLTYLRRIDVKRYAHLIQALELRK